jgi:hypothetical protein
MTAWETNKEDEMNTATTTAIAINTTTIAAIAAIRAAGWSGQGVVSPEIVKKAIRAEDVAGMDQVLKNLTVAKIQSSARSEMERAWVKTFPGVLHGTTESGRTTVVRCPGIPGGWQLSQDGASGEASVSAPDGRFVRGNMADEEVVALVEEMRAAMPSEMVPAVIEGAADSVVYCTGGVRCWSPEAEEVLRLGPEVDRIRRSYRGTRLYGALRKAGLEEALRPELRTALGL